MSDGQEIIFDDGGLYLAARHLGDGQIEVFANWSDGSKFGTTKVYHLSPVEGEILLTRVRMKMKPNKDGLDITDIN